MELNRAVSALPWRTSLRWKLIIPLIFVSLLVAVPVMHFELERGLGSFKAETKRRAQTVSTVLAHQCAVSVALGDETWTSRLVASALRSNEIVYCAVIDDSGAFISADQQGEAEIGTARRSLCLRPLAVTNGEKKRKAKWDVVEELNSRSGETVLEVLHPLLFSSRTGSEDFPLLDEPAGDEQEEVRVGFLRLGISLERGQRLVRQQNRRTFGTVTVVVFLCLVIVYFIVSYTVRPLHDVALSAARVARGELDEKVRLSTYDEIGELVSAFNMMVERLRESRSFNEVVGTTVPLGLLLLDEDGSVTGANPYAGKVLNVPQEELAGRPITEFLAKKEFTKALADCEKPGDKIRLKISVLGQIDLSSEENLSNNNNIPLPMLKRKRTDIDVLISNLPENQRQGPAKRLLVLQDITEFEQQREHTKAMERRLLQSGRLASLGQLAAGVAHEFNNILQIISTYTELALIEAKDSGLKSNLERVFAGTERASQIVSGLLAFARRLNLRKSRHDIAKVIEETIVLVAYGFTRKSIRVVKAIENTPKISIDAGQIQQVLINLFQNAAHAMIPGGGTLSIKTHYLAGATIEESDDDELEVKELPIPDGVIEVIISDTGRGIAPNDMPRIFDPFFSTKGVYARSEVERQHQGTGLGLALCYGIISNHHGEISVESTLGKGTTFSLRLPVYPDDVEVKSDSGGLYVGDSTSLAGISVLVVDDEKEIVEQITNYLSAKGLNAVSAMSGQQALDILNVSSKPFDIVISDILMPGLSGFELLQRVREAELARHVLLLTGKFTEEISFLSHQSGADGCIAKPIKMSDLMKCISDTVIGSGRVLPN